MAFDPSNYSACVAAWRMDDADISGTSLSDASGNGHTGTLVNSPTTGQAGKYNQAVSFSAASSQYINCGASPAGGLSAVTIAAWVKFTTNQGGMLAEDGTGYNYNSFYLYLLNSKPDFEIYCNGSYDAFTCSAAQNSGNWVHIACTWSSGNRTKVFLNGSAAAGSNSGSARTGVLATGNRALILAATPGTLPTVSSPYDGTMDDFRIYNSVLSDADIAALASWDGSSGGGIPSLLLRRRRAARGFLYLGDLLRLPRQRKGKVIV